jgi:hypothetical protein
MFRSLDLAALGVGIALVVGLVYLARRAGVTANTFNPASNQNAASRLVDSIIAGATGDKNQTLGGLFYDAVNPAAGLGAGEVLTADGRIAYVAPSVLLNQGGADFSLFGEESGAGFVSTAGGAAVYVPRRF